MSTIESSDIKNISMHQCKIMEYVRKISLKVTMPPMYLYAEIRTDGHNVALIELLVQLGFLFKRSDEALCVKR